MDFTILTGVMVGATFLAATATVGVFLMYAISQEPTDQADHAFRPATYQPMTMLTHRTSPEPAAPPAPAPAAADVAAAA